MVKSSKKQRIGKPLQFDYTTVVKIAMETFWKFGYANTSIEMLEEATHLSRSSITNTFQNKRWLYVACIEQYKIFLFSRLIAPLYIEWPSGREILKGFFEHLLELNNDAICGGSGCLILNTANEFAGKDGTMTAMMQENMDGIKKEFEKVLARGKWDHSLQNVPPDAINILIAFFITINIISKTLSDQKVRTEFTGVVIKMIESWKYA